MLCGVLGSRGAAGRGSVGAASICASALVGWRGGVCLWGWACGDVPQSPSFPPCLPEGPPQAPEDIQVVLGCGELTGLSSLGMERIGQHCLPCSPRHPSRCRPESTVLCRLPARPVDEALEGGLRPGPLPQVPQLRVVQRCHHGPWAGLSPWAGGERGRGRVWWGHGESWRWLAWGSRRSPVPWGCAGSGRGAAVRRHMGMLIRTLPWGRARFHEGGGNRASATRGQTSGTGRGVGTLLVAPWRSSGPVRGGPWA